MGLQNQVPWAWWEVSEVPTEVAGGLFVSKYVNDPSATSTIEYSKWRLPAPKTIIF